ncbi:T9SS type A sorting domain-containing protein [Polaribacter sp. Z014]|uniref:T9SS type A sorting domain-containing protein n=1 Tax=unclassified Polaribacter TaxID=196858 RepID=UPI00193C388C|nr:MULTISPECIES: T9SS type A sorting domain-containing protein [unclassified Polaribacter]MCL7761874.1 T9SS type A sorting domain-containing protein [Polaribacter sp. Z014]QVY64730.1 T9SS type A sorting domain-containing protein [Polaribacter sp. Q13]
MMKKHVVLAFSVLVFFNLFAQDQFTVQIEPLTIIDAPSVHSFSWGKTSDGKWIVIGGRIDGLHQRQPNTTFLENDNNKSVYVIDPVANKTWSTTLSVLQASIFEQLQATNQEFYQKENTLYIIGGYGFSATDNDHITYDKLTAIDVDGLANAVINDTTITSFFRQISNTNLAVTGGQLGLLNDVFYLCGGQYFKGKYNPQGPNNAQGFIQSYTDEIRTFKINDDGTNLSIVNYSAQNDTDHLHRRDYNMAPQIFPDGSEGFTMFSGVFQPTANLPWLNTVDVSASGYTVNNTFNQYLSQYHSAKIPIYDTDNNTMHTLFFGGLSQYKLDANNNLIQDDNVPFVKTISKVSRFSDGSMTESSLGIEMPTLLGSGAEFIPTNDTSIFLTEEIIAINNLQEGNTLAGYIFGGIESTQENIFFINDGSQSSASNLAFKVFINKTTLSTGEVKLNLNNIYNLKVYPNPSTAIFSLDVFIPNLEKSSLDVYDILGKKVKTQEIENSIGLQTIPLDLSEMASGEYILKFKNNTNIIEKKIIKD